MKIQKHVGRKVTKYRKAKGLSQEQLSFEAGFHRTYISQVERGVINPTIGSLEKIARALAVPSWELIEPK